MNFKRALLFVLGVAFMVVGMTACDPVPRRTLTNEEKAADLFWVYSQFGENYAPLEYKQSRFGFDYERLKAETNEAAKIATTNDEFYAVVFKFVSQFRDAHSSAALTNASLPNRAMVAYLGFSGIRDGETLLITSLLPTIASDSGFPIEKKDRILKLNGRLLRDVVNSDLLQWRNLGNDEANFTFHANKLFTHVSTANGIPSEDDAVLTVKRGDQIFDVTLPWVKKDLVQFQAEQTKAKEAVKAKKATPASENYLMLADGNGGVLFKFRFIGFDGRIELPVMNAETISRKFRKNVSESFRMIDAFAGWQFLSADAEKAENPTPEMLMREQRFVPEDAVFLNNAKVYPAYISRENGTLVGTIYLDTFSPLETPQKTLVEFKATLSSFQLLGVENVVLDLINNGGGSLALGMQLAQALSNEKIELPKIQLRTSDSWMDQFETDALNAKNDAERELSRRILMDLTGTRRSGSRLSQVYSAEILAPFAIKPNEKMVKKMKYAVLINEMCASMCDIFSANLQDNKLAMIVGTQSMGAGGNVVGYNQAPNSHFDVRQTESLIVRKDGSYVENVGTTPDVVVPVANYAGTKYKEVRAAAVKALLTR